MCRDRWTFDTTANSRRYRVGLLRFNELERSRFLQHVPLGGVGYVSRVVAGICPTGERRTQISTRAFRASRFSSRDHPRSSRVSSTNDRTSEDQFVRPTVEAIGANDGFNAAAPIPLPHRWRTAQRRPSRLLPPAASRYPFSADEPPSFHWIDRIWVPTALASLIAIAAIGSSLHSDWTAKQHIDRNLAAAASPTRSAAGSAPTSPAPPPDAQDRAAVANLPIQSDSVRFAATPSPRTSAPEDIRRPMAALPEPAPVPASATAPSVPLPVAGPPPVAEIITPPSVRQASAAMLAPPSVTDQPPPPLVEPTPHAGANSVTVPRIPHATIALPFASAVPVSVRAPPPPAVQSVARSSPKVSRIAARSSAKRAVRWTDPDAPPRTWHGALHRQLMRTAP